jgi:HK97 family phage major capsid protein
MILGDGAPSLFGYQMVSTNQVPSDLTKGVGTGLSAEIFGNFNDLILAEWSGIDLLVDPYTASNTGTTRVTAFFDVDVGVRHASSFAAIKDMVTS